MYVSAPFIKGKYFSLLQWAPAWNLLSYPPVVQKLLTLNRENSGKIVGSYYILLNWGIQCNPSFARFIVINRLHCELQFLINWMYSVNQVSKHRDGPWLTRYCNVPWPNQAEYSALRRQQRPNAFCVVRMHSVFSILIWKIDWERML